MAKTDLFLKRKFNRFALMLAEDYAGRNRRLQAVAKILALGFLETLWQKAYADGSDYLGDGIDVELAVDWPGKRGSFAEMLLRCGGDGPGVIEEIPDRPGRYRIHDFWDHAPAQVKRRARRNAEGRKYLGIDSAMRDPEYLAGLYDGPNEGLADAIRESLKIFEPDAEEEVSFCRRLDRLEALEADGDPLRQPGALG